MSANDPREQDTTSQPGPMTTRAVQAIAEGKSRSYLLVVENGSSWQYYLPAQGEVVIGRAPEVEIKLSHASVSRKHATIFCTGGLARVADLESHNGTKVNGEVISGSRALATGDVVSVGEVVLVVHAERRAAGARAPVSECEWRRRLTEEVERSLTYRRPLAVVALAGIPADGRAVALAALADSARIIDVAGEGDDGQLLFLYPELDRDSARTSARRAVTALAARMPTVRAGVAGCPADAADADTLLLAARAAARAAGPATVALPAETVTRIELGDRVVLAADPLTVREFDLIARIAPAELPILIAGETGVGKENAAFAVHFWSDRRRRPFVPINCAAIPENLVESELFGHERGAFSGAATSKEGLLEAAAGGTIFLDEIGELPLQAQAKLLRALDAKKITRLGDVRERPIDVRIVAATNRSLGDEVKAGRFREDLFFRLCGAKVWLPPLRERRCEIPVLAREFLGQAMKKQGRELRISSAAMQVLLTYDWPGNVRELKHVMEYVAATVEDVVVEPVDLQDRLTNALGLTPSVDAEPSSSGSTPPVADSRFPVLADEIRDLERRRMAEALATAAGVKTRAAQLIGMPIRTFTQKLKLYGL